jgi:hypothetical protein
VSAPKTTSKKERCRPAPITICRSTITADAQTVPPAASETYWLTRCEARRYILARSYAYDVCSAISARVAAVSWSSLVTPAT